MGILNYKNQGEFTWYTFHYLGFIEIMMLCKQFGFKFGTMKFSDGKTPINHNTVKTNLATIHCPQNAKSIFECDIQSKGFDTFTRLSLFFSLILSFQTLFLVWDIS